jgi:hypothetical protein
MDESRSKRTQGSFKGANASSENVKAYQALRRSPPPESVAPGDRTGPPTITADAPRGMTKRTCRAAGWVWRPGELLDDKLENLINRRLITWQFAGRSRRQPSRELQAAENGGFSETCEPSGFESGDRVGQESVRPGHIVTELECTPSLGQKNGDSSPFWGGLFEHQRTKSGI